MGMFSKSFVGIDMGSSHFDCATLEKKAKIIELKDYFAIQKQVLGEERAEDQGKIAREVLARKVGNSKASISIPDRNFLVITFKLPKLPPKEKEIAIRSEIEQKIPFPLEECAFDVIRLNAKETNDNDYVAFCTRISDVNRYHTVASTYNLSPDRVVTEMVANLNCALFNGYLEQKEISYLLMDLGAMHIGFTLVTNNLPWLTFTMSVKDAFVAKMMDQDFDPKNFFVEHIHEVGKVISSFEEKSVIAPVKKILLFGKAPLVESAIDKIPTITSLALEKVDPLRNITVGTKLTGKLDLAMVSSVAIGLALTNVDKLEGNNAKN